MITIWGNADSVNVQKILWCCEELALPYRRIDAGRHFGVVNTEAFRKLNPNRLVPTIDDAGFVLWESNAILRYLAARYSEGVLWPTDSLERAKSDRWMDWSLTTLWPSLVPLFRAFMRTPEANRDQNAIENPATGGDCNARHPRRRLGGLALHRGINAHHRRLGARTGRLALVCVTDRADELSSPKRLVRPPLVSRALPRHCPLATDLTIA